MDNWVLKIFVSVFVIVAIAPQSFAKETPDFNMYPDERYHQIMEDFAIKAELRAKSFNHNMIQDFKINLAQVLNVLYTISEVRANRPLPPEILNQYGYPTEGILLDALQKALQKLIKSSHNHLVYERGDLDLSLKMIVVLSETISDHANDFQIRDARIKKILTEGLIEAVTAITHSDHSVVEREWSHNNLKYFDKAEESIRKMSKALSPPTFTEKLRGIIKPSGIKSQSGTLGQCFRLFVSSR